jgi:hypothetical protein
VPDDQVPLFLTTEELAARYRTTPDAIRGLRKLGKAPPGFRVGRRVVYPVADMLTWEREQANADKFSRGRLA